MVSSGRKSQIIAAVPSSQILRDEFHWFGKQRDANQSFATISSQDLWKSLVAVRSISLPFLLLPVHHSMILILSSVYSSQFPRQRLRSCMREIASRKSAWLASQTWLGYRTHSSRPLALGNWILQQSYYWLAAWFGFAAPASQSALLGYLVKVKFTTKRAASQ